MARNARHRITAPIGVETPTHIRHDVQFDDGVFEGYVPPSALTKLHNDGYTIDRLADAEEDVVEIHSPEHDVIVNPDMSDDDFDPDEQ